MANRTILVTLRANAAQYIAEMEKAGVRTRETGDATERLAAQRTAFTELGQGALAFGAAAAAGVALAVSKFAEFDQRMSYVQAATHESAENMGLLRDSALEAGAETVYSASEAAAAIEQLAKAGVSTADILGGGLSGALDLAASESMDVAEAAEIMASTLNQFQLEGKESARVADLLAAGAGKAQGSASDLGQALNQTGQVAKMTGLDIAETTAGLAAFAAQGTVGSDAGTAFKSMLQRLTPQSNEARQAMADLGISAFDANGNFIGLAEYAGVLQEALQVLTPEQRASAMATIFGSDAVRAANTLYVEGEQGIRDWTTAVDDQGYAAETAAQRLDNLSGDVEALDGAFDTALIQSGSGANDSLRFLTQTATTAVETFTNLPGPVQQGALALGAVLAVTGLVSGAFMTGVPKVAAYRENLSQMGTGAQRAGRYLERAAKGAGALALAATAVAALETWRTAVESGATSTEQLSNGIATAVDTQKLLRDAFGDKSFLGYAGDADKATEALGALIDETSAAPDMRWMGVLGEGLFALDPAADQVRDQFDKLGGSFADIAGTDLPAAQDAFRRLTAEHELNADQQQRLLDMMPEYRDALTAQLTEAGITADQQSILNLAIGEGTAELEAAEAATRQQEAGLEALAGVASDSGEEIEELADTIRGFAAFVYGARDAAREFEAAIDAVAESVSENGTTLDISTEAGRQNEAALDALASSSLELAASTYERTRSEEDARGAVQRGREELIRALDQFGITGQAAEDYADELGLIPDNVNTFIALDTSAATTKLNNWVEGMNGKRVNIATSWTGGLVSANGNLVDHQAGRLQAFSGGGFATGIYAAQPRSIHKFAEPETRWEAYVSGKPGMEDRNEAIAHESLVRLGRPAVSFEALRAAPMAAPQVLVATGSAPGAGAGNQEAHIHLHSPIVRDINQDAADAAEVARAVLG